MGCAGNVDEAGRHGDALARPEWLRCTAGRDTLSCASAPASPPMSLVLARVLVGGADLRMSEAGVAAEAPLPELPAEARVDLYFASPTSNEVGTSLAALTSLSLRSRLEPGGSLSVEEPFDLWRLGFRTPEMLVIVETPLFEVPLAPFSDAPLHVQESAVAQDGEPAPMLVPMARDARGLTIRYSFDGIAWQTVELDGPGDWILDAGGAHRQAATETTPPDAPVETPPDATPPDTTPPGDMSGCGGDGQPSCAGSCAAGTININDVCRACGSDGKISCYGVCQDGTVPVNDLCTACGSDGKISCYGVCREGTTQVNGLCWDCGTDGKLPCDGVCKDGTTNINGLCRA